MLKRMFIILVILIITTMGLVSQEESHDYDIKVDNIILTFNIQKITYQGQQGWFIPHSGYDKLRLVLIDYVYLQDLNSLMDSRIQRLEKYELAVFRLRTALGVTIAVDIGAVAIGVAGCLVSYNIGVLQ